jgi:hypothetical protein
MQAPNPPQKKTAQKTKVWAKKTIKKKLGNQWILKGGGGGGPAQIFFQPVK